MHLDLHGLAARLVSPLRQLLPVLSIAPGDLAALDLEIDLRSFPFHASSGVVNLSQAVEKLLGGHLLIRKTVLLLRFLQAVCSSPQEVGKCDLQLPAEIENIILPKRSF